MSVDECFLLGISGISVSDIWVTSTTFEPGCPLGLPDIRTDRGAPSENPNTLRTVVYEKNNKGRTLEDLIFLEKIEDLIFLEDVS